MKPVLRSEIVDYQTYEERRQAVRDDVMAIKAVRRVHVGEHLTFLFENRDTVRYQVQEMMRAERIVKESAIMHELATYNELLGGSGELGACLLIEIDDGDKRAELLRRWLPLVDHIYMQLEDGSRVQASYDPRQVGEDRLSAVQYLRFAVGNGVPVEVGCDFPEVTVKTELSEAQRAALLADLAD